MIVDFGIATSADVVVGVYQHQHLVIVIVVVQFFARRDVLLFAVSIFYYQISFFQFCIQWICEILVFQFVLLPLSCCWTFTLRCCCCGLTFVWPLPDVPLLWCWAFFSSSSKVSLAFFESLFCFLFCCCDFLGRTSSFSSLDSFFLWCPINEMLNDLKLN